MIIKGKSRTGGKALGNYLLNEGHWAEKADKNERVEVWEGFGVVPEMKGTKAALTLQEALQNYQQSAEGTQCQKPLYHVQFRTDAGEHLTREQWVHSVNTLEEKLGLSGHDRVMVAHTMEGQEHVHVVWNRIDYETGRAAELSHDGRKRVEVARELEREFDLRQLREAGHGRLNEKEQALATRYGKKPEEIKATIQDCYRRADNGEELKENLSATGMLLVAGDRREFLVVDEDGIHYALGRAVGEKAKAVREKLSDLDRASLPSLEEAREQQRERREELKLTVKAEIAVDLLKVGITLEETAPEQRAAAREEHREAVADYREHRAQEHADRRQERGESRSDHALSFAPDMGQTASRAADIGRKGLDLGTGIVGGIADKAVDIIDEAFDLLAGSTKQRTPAQERQEGNKHENTPEARDAKAERTPEPTREAAPKREETAGEMRRRLMEEAAKILEQERQRDREEGRTRSRSRGR